MAFITDANNVVVKEVKNLRWLLTTLRTTECVCIEFKKVPQDYIAYFHLADQRTFVIRWSDANVFVQWIGKRRDLRGVPVYMGVQLSPGSSQHTHTSYERLSPMPEVTYTSKHRRSHRDGYGNRTVVTCDLCGKVVSDHDPGNGAGFRYAAHYRQMAIDAHTREHQDHSNTEGEDQAGGAFGIEL